MAARRPQRGAEATPLVLDSSCWIEYFADSDRADLFAAAVEAVETLIVPVRTVCEVVKKLAREMGDIVDVDPSLALDSAISGLPMADSLICATAHADARCSRCRH